MINKKNILGKIPKELGTKDAVHVATVSVRAAEPISRGARINLNEHREAVNDANGPGIADPFNKKIAIYPTGTNFLMLMNQEEIPNVRHEWEHPTLDFTPPVREVKYNYTLAETAKDYGVTYQQLMEAADYVYTNYSSAPYPEDGKLSTEELEEVYLERWDFWSEWAAETSNEFENNGSSCCPEYDYPNCPLFTKCY